jgi:hypothetical protein
MGYANNLVDVFLIPVSGWNFFEALADPLARLLQLTCSGLALRTIVTRADDAQLEMIQPRSSRSERGSK